MADGDSIGVVYVEAKAVSAAPLKKRAPPFVPAHCIALLRLRDASSTKPWVDWTPKKRGSGMTVDEFAAKVEQLYSEHDLSNFGPNTGWRRLIVWPMLN